MAASRPKLIPRNCGHCGAPYMARPDSLKIGRGLYCSKKCGAAPRKTSVPVTCLGCGVGFEIAPSRLKDDRGGKYCSDECCRKHRYVKVPLEDRFWDKVDVRGPDECWPWKAGASPKGYGMIGAGGEDGKTLMATHVAWRLTNGPIPDGRWLLHRCDFPPCCNPAHLFLGDNAMNTQDKVDKGRQRRGETAPMAKLTDAKVVEMRRLFAEGKTTGEIAEMFDVHYNTAYKIVRGQRWTHIA